MKTFEIWDNQNKIKTTVQAHDKFEAWCVYIQEGLDQDTRVWDTGKVDLRSNDQPLGHVKEIRND